MVGEHTDTGAAVAGPGLLRFVAERNKAAMVEAVGHSGAAVQSPLDLEGRSARLDDGAGKGWLARPAVFDPAYAALLTNPVVGVGIGKVTMAKILAIDEA